MSLTTNNVTRRPAPASPAHDHAGVTRAGELAAELHDVCRELDGRPLRPGPGTDELFGRLVRLVCTTGEDVASLVLDKPDVQRIGARLRLLSARGESELERHWAARIAASPAPWDELARFPYLENYRRLCTMEVGVLASAMERPRSVAFIGAGPLPLSALLLTKHLDAPVQAIDNDAAAVDAAARVADALGDTGVTVRHGDAEHTDLSSHDVVVLAALVGRTGADKHRILHHLAGSMRRGSLVLVRSARGLRTMLYPAVDASAFAGFDLLAEVHPVNGVINSAVLARVRGV